MEVDGVLEMLAGLLELTEDLDDQVEGEWGRCKSAKRRKAEGTLDKRIVRAQDLLAAQGYEKVRGEWVKGGE